MPFRVLLSVILLLPTALTAESRAEGKPVVTAAPPASESALRNVELTKSGSLTVQVIDNLGNPLVAIPVHVKCGDRDVSAVTDQSGRLCVPELNRGHLSAAGQRPVVCLPCLASWHGSAEITEFHRTGQRRSRHCTWQSLRPQKRLSSKRLRPMRKDAMSVIDSQIRAVHHRTWRCRGVCGAQPRQCQRLSDVRGGRFMTSRKDSQSTWNCARGSLRP